MMRPKPGKAGFITSLILLCLLLVTVAVNLLLLWLGNWERDGWGLRLALRIVWGCCVVGCLATLLTRVTIFGWNFRRYLRWPGNPAQAPPDVPRRPTAAPWYKSPAASFSITVVMVSLTGAVAIATAVLWMLVDVIGEWAFWLIFKILWSAWWVGCVATVLTRVAIFGVQKKRAEQQAEQQEGVKQ
jgi:hypothetical protein